QQFGAVSFAMGSATAIASFARHTFRRNLDVDPAGPRNGSLLVLQVLRCVCNPAVLYPSAHTDRNSGRVYSHSFSDSLAIGAVRYWNRRSNCRIRRSRTRDVCGAGVVQAVALSDAGCATWLSADLPAWTTPAACHGIRNRRTAAGSRIASSHGHCRLGGHVCNVVEFASWWTT